MIKLKHEDSICIVKEREVCRQEESVETKILFRCFETQRETKGQRGRRKKP